MEIYGRVNECATRIKEIKEQCSEMNFSDNVGLFFISVCFFFFSVFLAHYL